MRDCVLLRRAGTVEPSRCREAAPASCRICLAFKLDGFFNLLASVAIFFDVSAPVFRLCYFYRTDILKESTTAMQELATRTSGAKFSTVRLRFWSTDIPGDALPRRADGTRMILPASARLSLIEDGLLVEVISLEPGVSYYNDEPDFDDENPSIIKFPVVRKRMLQLEIGGHTRRNHYPTAVLVVSDPGEIVDSFTLTFASQDFNNPDYAIKVFANMLRDGLAVPIEDVTPEPKRNSTDIPF